MGKSYVQSFFESIEVPCRSYSGRGMFGKTCLGVDVDDNNVGKLVSQMLEGLGELCIGGVDEDDGFADTCEELADAFRNMCTDQMGLGMIVYFPDVPHVDADDGTEQET